MVGIGTAALSGKTALARTLALASTSARAGVGVVEGPATARTRAGPAVLLVGDDAVGVGLGEGLLALLEETAAFGGVLGPGAAAAGLPGGGGGGVGGEDGQQAEGEKEEVAAVEDHGGGGRCWVCRFLGDDYDDDDGDTGKRSNPNRIDCSPGGRHIMYVEIFYV